MPSAIAAHVTCTGQPSGTVSSTTRVITRGPHGGRPRCQTENEENGKKNFGGTDEERHDLRHRKRVRAARQMQLELRAEKENRNVVQLQETVPFVDTGSPEWSREPDA